MTRKEALRQLWRDTHSDFKGRINGQRSIMVFKPSLGSCVVLLDDLTEAELADKVKGYTPQA